MKKIINKRGFEVSFAWLFAIIVGIVIIFLAIYASVKFIGMKEYELDTTTAKKIGILMNPLETSFESGASSSMILPSETRIYGDCINSGIFGEQKIFLSQKSFGKWTLPGPEEGISFQNKYIFSKAVVEGNKFYLFSKPFDYPFKVANLIFLTSAKDGYCFINPPEDIEEEISNLNQENLKLESDGNCTEEDVKVCFESVSELNCSMEVIYNSGNEEDKGYGYVIKNGNRLDFSGSLIYGAIFADKEIYECQVKRLMKRLEQLSQIYYDKSRFISARGCNSGLESELKVLENSARNFDSSNDLMSMNTLIENINAKNKEVDCKLW